MRFSLLTYNTLFNRATVGLKTIIDRYHPDIVCLQEVDTNEKNFNQLEKLNYRLADYANSFLKFERIFGVATFYNRQKFMFLESQTLNLPRTIIEMVLTIIQLILRVNKPKTVLKTDFLHKSTKKKVSVFNVHLILFTTNEVRIKHIKQVLDSFHVTNNQPLIIAGDFNYYPYSRKKLEKMMKKYGLTEATRNIRQTVQFSSDGKFEHFNLIQKLSAKIINRTIIHRLKLDYIFFKDLKLKETKRIEVKYSDHYPILSIFYL